MREEFEGGGFEGKDLREECLRGKVVLRGKLGLCGRGSGIGVGYLERVRDYLM